MEQRRLGATGLYVSRLALGTMSWGRDTDEDDASSQLKEFVEVGGTLIDTADVYVDGESERVVKDIFRTVGIEKAQKIVGGNAAALWGI